MDENSRLAAVRRAVIRSEANDPVVREEAYLELVRHADEAPGTDAGRLAQLQLEKLASSRPRDLALEAFRGRIDTLPGLGSKKLEVLLADLFDVQLATSEPLRTLRKNALHHFVDLADQLVDAGTPPRPGRIEELTALFGKYSAAHPDLSSEWDDLQWLLSMLARDCTNDALLVQLEDALRKCEVDEASRLRVQIKVGPVRKCASRSRIAAAMVEQSRRLETVDQELAKLIARCQGVASRLEQLGTVSGEAGSADWKDLSGIVESTDALDRLLAEGCIPADLGNRAREQRAATEVWLLGALRSRIGGCSDIKGLIDCCRRIAALRPVWFDRIEPEWLAPVRDSYRQVLDARLAAAAAAVAVGELTVRVRADSALLSATLPCERLVAAFGLARWADLLERLSVLWRELPTGVPVPSLDEFAELDLPSEFLKDYGRFAKLAVKLEHLKADVEAVSEPVTLRGTGAIQHRGSIKVDASEWPSCPIPTTDRKAAYSSVEASIRHSPNSRRPGFGATDWQDALQELAAYAEILRGRARDLEEELESLLKSREVDVALMRVRRTLEVIVADWREQVLGQPIGVGQLDRALQSLAGKVPDRVHVHMHNVKQLGNFGPHRKPRTGGDVRAALSSLNEVLMSYVIDVLNISITAQLHADLEPEYPCDGYQQMHAGATAAGVWQCVSVVQLTPAGRGNMRLHWIDRTLSRYRRLYPDYQPIAELSAMVRLKWAAALCDAALSTWNAAELRALLAEEQEAGLGEHYAIYAALVADPQALEDLCDTARVADPADATEAGRWWIRWEGAKRRLPALATWPEAFSAQVADQEDRRRALWLGAIDELLADSSATAEDLGAVADLAAPAVGGLAELGPRVADLAEHELAAYRVRGDLSQIEAFLANAERFGRLVPADAERWGVWVALERLKTVCCRERISIWNTRFAQFVPALGRSAAAALLQLIDECVSPAGDTDPWALFERIAGAIDRGVLAGEESDALLRRIRFHQCVRQVAPGFPAGSSDQAIGPWIQLTRCWHGELTEDERAAVRPFIAALVADWREHRDIFALYWAYQVLPDLFKVFPAGSDPGKDLRDETVERVKGLRQRLSASAGFPDDAVLRAVRDECEGLVAAWRHLAVCVSEAPIPTDPIAAPDGLANLVRDLGHLRSAAEAIAALRVADYLADQTDKLFHDCESAAMVLERDGFAAGTVCREELNRLSELFAARFHYRHFRESAVRLKRRDTLHETGAYQPLIGDVKAISDAVGRATLTNPEQQNRLLANALLRVLENEGEECPNQGQDRDLNLVVGCIGDLERVEESTIENIKALEITRPIVGNIDPERAEYAGFFALFPAVPPGSKRQRQRYCLFVQREPMRQILRRAERRLPKWLQTVCGDEARQGAQ